MTCGTCVYFDVIVSYENDDTPPDEGVPESICRRFPPSGDGWPVVLADDWCGEFRSLPDDEKEINPT